MSVGLETFWNFWIIVAFDLVFVRATSLRLAPATKKKRDSSFNSRPKVNHDVNLQAANQKRVSKQEKRAEKREREKKRKKEKRRAIRPSWVALKRAVAYRRHQQLHAKLFSVTQLPNWLHWFLPINSVDSVSVYCSALSIFFTTMGCLSCLKWIVFVFNFIFWVILSACTYANSLGRWTLSGNCVPRRERPNG